MPPFRPSRLATRAALPGLAIGALTVVCAVASVAALAAPGLLPMDRLSAAFLLAACLAATAGPAPAARAAFIVAVACIASPGLFGLALGIGLACLLSARTVFGSGFGAIPVLAAAALLGGGWFDAARSHPPETATAVAVLILSFAAAVPLLAGWSPALAVAGLYLLARMAELCGPSAPGWWGLVLMPTGTALAAAGAWAAMAVADTVPAVGHRLFTAGLGLALTALGAEMAARGSDLTDLASVANAGLLTTVVATSLAFGMVALAGRGIAAGAGTVRLARLGGLAGSMPCTAACLAAAGVSLAFVPPSLGFAGLWLTGQAVLGLPRNGTAGVVIAVSGAAAGLALGCTLASVLRVLATACLGQPRTPRASAATDGRGLVPFAGTALLAAAGLAAGPVVQLLTGAPALSPWLTPGLFALLAIIATPAVLLARSRRHAAPWNDGRDPPPPWLPFGDPAGQWGAASFAALFRFPVAWPDLRRRWPTRPVAAAPALLFAALLAAALLAARP